MEKKSRIKKQVLALTLITIVGVVFISLQGCGNTQEIKTNPINTQASPTDTVLPHPDHIIFVWLENKGFESIIGNTDAPYINSLLKRGTLFTNSYAISHPSYPNYVEFFAGDDNGITSNACIQDAPLDSPNLYTILKAAGKSFAWYSEDLPATGSRICAYENYVQRHNPVTIFANVPDSINKKFDDFPVDYTKLENVVCISPNLENDMHDGTVKQGDKWVKKNLDDLADWCRRHNSIFVIYFDESETDKDNRIPVIAIGQHVKKGNKINTEYNHYSWTKTISAMFFANTEWTGYVNAAKTITGW